jgi:hypothetical protein
VTSQRWAVDIALIAAGVVSVLFEPTSIAIHSVIGLIFAGAVGPHLWNRRSWIRGTLRRLWLRRLTAAMRWSLWQAVVLSVLVVVVTVSGLWDWLDVPTKIRWHAISSVILIAVAVRHAWTRRDWLLRRRGRAPARPPQSPAPQSPAPQSPAPQSQAPQSPAL